MCYLGNWLSDFSEDPDDDNDGILDVDEDDDDDDDDDEDELWNLRLFCSLLSPFIVGSGWRLSKYLWNQIKYVLCIEELKYLVIHQCLHPYYNNP